MTHWKEAAERYRNHTPNPWKKNLYRAEDPSVVEAARTLVDFVTSPEGEAGIELLRHSRNYIHMGEMRIDPTENSNDEVIYILSGAGFLKFFLTRGGHFLPQTFNVDFAIEVVLGAVSSRGVVHSPEDIVDHVKYHLDRIAAKAEKLQAAS